MKRIGILAMGLAGLTLIATGGLSITQQKGGVKFDIAYLDDITTGTRSKLSATSGSELTLDDQKDAYVLNQNTFNNLSEESAEAYLNNGGVIVVNDNEVSSEELKKKIRYYNEPAVPKRDGGRFLYSAPPSLKEERQYIMEGSNDKI